MTITDTSNALEEQVEQLTRERDAALQALAALRATANLVGWAIFQSQQPDVAGHTKYDHPTGDGDGLLVYHASSEGRSRVREAAKCVWKLLGDGELPTPFPGALTYDVLDTPAKVSELAVLYLTSDETPRGLHA